MAQVYSVKVRNDSYSRSRWFGKTEISKSGISFFFPHTHTHTLSLSLSLCLHAQVPFLWSSSVRSSPDRNGRFSLVGCGGYITALMTRASSCFLLPRLKVNLSGGGALQHPLLRIQCASETHTRSLSLSLALSLSRSLALRLCLSLLYSQRRIEGEPDAQKLFSPSSVIFLAHFAPFRARRRLRSTSFLSEKLLGCVSASRNPRIFSFFPPLPP